MASGRLAFVTKIGCIDFLMKHDSSEPSFNSGTASQAEAAQTRVPLVAPTQRPVVPEQVRALLGPSWIIEGEDPELYEELLAGVGAAVQPKDLIDWLLLKDVVALTWEIQRTRRHRDSLMRLRRIEAMKTILSSIFPAGEHTEALALGWFHGEKEATKGVAELLAQAGLSAADVTAQSILTNAHEFDRLDRQNELHENRRDALLQQIERRRSGWAKQIRRASEDIVDAEFKESAPNALTGRIRDEAAAGQK